MLRWRAFFVVNAVFSRRTEGMVRLAPPRFSCAAPLFTVRGKNCAGSSSPQPEKNGGCFASGDCSFVLQCMAQAGVFFGVLLFFLGVILC